MKPKRNKGRRNTKKKMHKVAGRVKGKQRKKK
jgi:hypothetical protein